MQTSNESTEIKRKEVKTMARRTKMLLILVSAAVVLALSIGAVAYAAGPGNGARSAVREGFGCGLYNDDEGVVSDLLGMTPQEIQSQRLDGKSLVEIAATKGVTEAQLVEAIMTEKRTWLEEQVANGVLTQERADFMLQNMEQATIQAVNRTQISSGNGAYGAFRMGNGYCGGFDQDDTDSGFYGGPGMQSFGANGTANGFYGGMGGGMMRGWTR